MLKKLIIRNYGLHKKLIIKFSPHITCLVGKSYAGKSTALRALRWVMLNRPAGSKIIRWGSKLARVSLFHKEDESNYQFKTTRKRSNSINEYRINLEDEAEQAYHAFGNTVPETIAKHLNVGEDNFQRQHDTPFWFGLSAGAVNRELNRIISLDQIDRSLKFLNSNQSQNNSKIKVLEERIDKLRKRRRYLHPFVELRSDIDDLEKAYRAIQNRCNFINALKLTIGNIEEAQAALRKPPSIETLSEIVAQIERQETILEDLEWNINEVVNRKKDMRYLKRELKRLNQEWKRKVGDVCPLCGKRSPSKENL